VHDDDALRPPFHHHRHVLDVARIFAENDDIAGLYLLQRYGCSFARLKGRCWRDSDIELAQNITSESGAIEACGRLFAGIAVGGAAQLKGVLDNVAAQPGLCSLGRYG